MRLLGNILWWFPCLGFVNAIISFFVGGLLTLTIVGAPLGLGLLQYAKFCLAPFSYSMMPASDIMPHQKRSLLWDALSLILFIIYLPIGILLFVTGIGEIIVLCLSIIMIPMAIPVAKSLTTLFNPIGKICVPYEVKTLAEQKKAEALYNAYQKRGRE